MITKHLTALKNLGEPTKQWSTLLVFLLKRKLDLDTQDRWETYQSKHNLNDKNEDESASVGLKQITLSL